MTKHEVGKCDICHKELAGYGSRGYISSDGNRISITRYCDECWKSEPEP